MTRHASTDCSVYGGYDGKVAFLDTPEGVIPPPYIAHLVYLGSPADVVTTAVNHLRPAPQQALADLLGTRQQYISRWQNGDVGPKMNDAQWAKLIRLVITANAA